MRIRTRSFAVMVLLLPALLVTGCAGGGADPRETQEEDILAAVQIYLREERGMNPDGMGMQLTNLAVDGDQAQATVQFTSPDGGSNLEVQYQLSRGEEGWTVTGSAGQSGHGGGMPGGPGGLPPEHPPIPEDPPQDNGAESPAETS